MIEWTLEQRIQPSRWLGEGLTPWAVVLLLKLFGNNLEVFPGLLKLSTKVILATVWKFV
jgi:hypothetical protein